MANSGVSNCRTSTRGATPADSIIQRGGNSILYVAGQRDRYTGSLRDLVGPQSLTTGGAAPDTIISTANELSAAIITADPSTGARLLTSQLTPLSVISYDATVQSDELRSDTIANGGLPTAPRRNFNGARVRLTYNLTFDSNLGLWESVLGEESKHLHINQLSVQSFARRTPANEEHLWELVIAVDMAADDAALQSIIAEPGYRFGTYYGFYSADAQDTGTDMLTSYGKRFSARLQGASTNFLTTTTSTISLFVSDVQFDLDASGVNRFTVDDVLSTVVTDRRIVAYKELFSNPSIHQVEKFAQNFYYFIEEGPSSQTFTRIANNVVNTASVSFSEGYLPVEFELLGDKIVEAQDDALINRPLSDGLRAASSIHRTAREFVGSQNVSRFHWKRTDEPDITTTIANRFIGTPIQNNFRTDNNLAEYLPLQGIQTWNITINNNFLTQNQLQIAEDRTLENSHGVQFITGTATKADLRVNDTLKTNIGVNLNLTFGLLDAGGNEFIYRYPAISAQITSNANDTAASRTTEYSLGADNEGSKFGTGMEIDHIPGGTIIIRNTDGRFGGSTNG